MSDIKPVSIDFFGTFKFDRCDRCGECLTHCPIMNFPLDKAKEEIKNLIVGNPTQILSDCQSCFTCNFYCEKGCNLTSLILQRWSEQYKREGLRNRGKYFMTLYPNYPNFRSYTLERMTKNERAILEKWGSFKPLKGDTLTYPGCNIILTPTLVQSRLFEECDIRGRLEYCCGETLFRTGYINELKQVTKRLDKWFNILKPKNLMVLCTAGTNVFRNILPNYGLNYQFESATSYIEWLWNRLETGKIRIERKLDYKVTIQDSCYSKMFGDDYMDLPRKILKKIGCEVIELPHNRENMKCCGIGAGFSVKSAYHPFKMRKATIDNLNAVKKTRADILCVYCSGCNQQYHVAKKLYLKGFKMEIYHIVELLQLAIGEEPERMIKRTASKMFWGIMIKQIPNFWSRKRFYLPPIPEDPAEDAY
ncbi:MAG: (Fe-S)-binding protein [Candidatus Heimdallarchaeota archaeon]|nr:MAG: (Fe-S)-binding protein [Candidatus Heimdallarchaeota archaeon]